MSNGGNKVNTSAAAAAITWRLEANKLAVEEPQHPFDMWRYRACVWFTVTERLQCEQSKGGYYNLRRLLYGFFSSRLSAPSTTLPHGDLRQRRNRKQKKKQQQSLNTCLRRSSGPWKPQSQSNKLRAAFLHTVQDFDRIKRESRLSNPLIQAGWLESKLTYKATKREWSERW